MSETKMVRVVDSSVTAEHPERVHDIIIGNNIKRFTFKFGEETRMSYEEGIKFNQEGFKVFEEGSNKEIMVPSKTDETIRARIGMDELVAKYEELTLSSLKVRAATLMGGERFLEVEDKGKIIEFLKAAVLNKIHEDELELEMDEEPAPAPIMPITEEELNENKGIGTKAHAPDTVAEAALKAAGVNPAPEPSENAIAAAKQLSSMNFLEGKAEAPEIVPAGDAETNEDDAVPFSDNAETNPDAAKVEGIKAAPKAEEPKEEAPAAPAGLPPLPNAENKPSEVKTEEYKA